MIKEVYKQSVKQKGCRLKIKLVSDWIRVCLLFHVTRSVRIFVDLVVLLVALYVYDVHCPTILEQGGDLNLLPQKGRDSNYATDYLNSYESVLSRSWKVYRS